MAAALMLEQAGFATELYESRSGLGGGLIASAAPPFKDKLTWYQDYLQRQLEASGVQVNLNSQFDMTVMDQGSPPTIVLLATGGRAIRLPVEGIDSKLVHDAYELLMGDTPTVSASPDLPLLVYGGGETGCETAELLSEQGHEVILVSRSPSAQLARSAEMIYRGVLIERLLTNPRIQILDNSTVVLIQDDGLVVLQNANGDRSELKVGAVLIAQGRRPDDSLLNAMLQAQIPVAAIGDARRGGRIGDAVHDAYRTIHTVCASSSPLCSLGC